MDRIVACSSGSLENVAISLIRCSGFLSREELQPLFKTNLTSLKAKTNYLLSFYDGEDLIDEVVAVFYDGPKSYTGENLLEIGIHGNKINRERVLKSFLKLPFFRLAKEGEFSKRAYLQGKIKLFEVEGLDLLLNATSTQELNYGRDLLFKKNFYDLFESLKLAYRKHRSIIELCLDFSEDLGENQQDSLLQESFLAFQQELLKLKNKIEKKNQVFSPQVLLYGPVNAGKSTLFNALLSQNRALVSTTPGTTRDYLSERVVFKGITFNLIDSAGLRESSDLIEQQGIDLTKDLLKEAFFKILVLAPDQSYEKEEADFIIYTHGDQKPSEGMEEHSLSSFPGKEDLFELVFTPIYEKYKKKYLDQPRILLERHVLLLENLLKKSEFYAERLHKKEDFVILLTLLQEIEMVLFELTGEITSEETLNHLFQSFCIGK